MELEKTTLRAKLHHFCLDNFHFSCVGNDFDARWKEALGFRNTSSASLVEILTFEDTSTADGEVDVVENLHDMLFKADQLMLVFFDASTVEKIIFQGEHSSSDWFQVRNIVSTSMWDLNQMSCATAHLGFIDNQFRFELSSHNRTRFYFKLACEGEEDGCAVLFSPTNLPTGVDTLKEALQFHIYTLDIVDEWKKYFTFGSYTGIDFEGFFEGTLCTSFDRQSFRARFLRVFPECLSYNVQSLAIARQLGAHRGLI